jgi:hypothetical protein
MSSGEAATFDVVFYADRGVSPAILWFRNQPPKVQEKFRVIFDLLAAQGSRLSRPYAAPLADKIYELRVRWQNVNYRLLYFFHGRQVAVVAHGCTKEARVAPIDIRRAVERRTRFLTDPSAHTMRMVLDEGG